MGHHGIRIHVSRGYITWRWDTYNQALVLFLDSKKLRTSGVQILRSGLHGS